MKPVRLCLFVLLITACSSPEDASISAADNEAAPAAIPSSGEDALYWPNWRGPNGNSTSSATGLPATWSEEQNVVWKVPLPWWSGSSPVIWGERVFVTSPSAPQSGEGEGARNPGGQTILLLCLNRADGSVLWQKEIGEGNQLQRKGNMASPSPVTDGTHVWAMDGNGDFVAFDMGGNEVWRRNLQTDFGKFGLNFGFGSSPLLYQDRLIVSILHGYYTDDPSYLLAVDKLTGKDLWRTIRPTDAIQESPDSYATPSLLTVNGKPQVVTNGGDVCTGHDVTTGEELWRVGGLNPDNSPWYRTIASTTVTGDTVFCPTREKPMLGIKVTSSGDAVAAEALWEAHGPDVPTPVSDGRYVWITNDRGIVTCLDIATGQPAYSPQRIATGTYSASPILADGKIYATSEEAVTTVLEASPEFKVIAENRLDDGYTLSTPAIAGNQIFIRTSTHLYCIAERESAE